MTIKLDNFSYDLIEQYYTQNILSNDFWLFCSHGSETQTPVSQNTDFDSIDILNRAVFGVEYNKEDISFMLPIIQWESGKVYTQYDDKKVLKNQPSYVVIEPEVESGNYNIFKCISNNNGSPSEEKPEFNPSIKDGIYNLSDGYIWKFMSFTPFTLFRKFAVRGLLPVLRNQQVEAISDAGIYNIMVENRAENRGYERITGLVRSISIENGITRIFLRDLFSRTLQSNPIFEVPNTYSGRSIYIKKSGVSNSIGSIETPIRISGVQDGVPFVTVTSPTEFTIDESDEIEILPRVEIVGNGQGASAITVFDESNTRIDSIKMITRGDHYTNAVARVVDPTFFDPDDTSRDDIRCKIRLIISSPGGHGSNILRELNAKHIGFSKIVTNIDDNNIPTAGTYSKFALVKNPEFQSGFDETSFDNRIKMELQAIPGGLSVGDTVSQGVVSGKVHQIDESLNTIFIVDYKGPHNETFVVSEPLRYQNINFDINSIEYSPYVKETGRVLTITDVAPVEREQESSEQVRIIIDF